MSLRLLLRLVKIVLFNIIEEAEEARSKLAVRLPIICLTLISMCLLLLLLLDTNVFCLRKPKQLLRLVRRFHIFLAQHEILVQFSLLETACICSSVHILGIACSFERARNLVLLGFVHGVAYKLALTPGARGDCYIGIHHDPFDLLGHLALFERVSRVKTILRQLPLHLLLLPLVRVSVLVLVILGLLLRWHVRN